MLGIKKDWKDSNKRTRHAVVHLAAETGTGQSMYEIEKYNDVNIMGTAHLLEIISKYGTFC